MKKKKWSLLPEEEGAFDMPSIIIGVIVVGILTAGVIATVFGVIPWAQDKAAKQDLGAVVMAQESVRALGAESVGSNGYQDRAGLVAAGVMGKRANFSNMKTRVKPDGSCFVATVKSASDKVFWADSDDTSVREYATGDDSDCVPLKKIAWDTNKSNVMKTTWDTRKAECATISLPVWGTINGAVGWGDGTTVALSEDVQHQYSGVTAEPTQVTIDGEFSGYGLDNSKPDCLLSVDEWGGGTNSNNLEGAFAFESTLHHVEEIPAGIKNMSGMFRGAATFNQDISDWDTSNVTSMTRMFSDTPAFNKPLNDWDTSSVASMTNMFYNSISYNQPLDDWDTSNVVSMGNIFGFARSFSQDLGRWDTGNTTDMGHMFNQALAMSQNVSGWNVAKVDRFVNFGTNSMLTPEKSPSKFR